MFFMLRLRNEFCLEELSWCFSPIFLPSRGFHRRFAGLVLSPTLKALSVHNSSEINELQDTYIPGSAFDRVVRFGEEDDIDTSRAPRKPYPFYKKLELGGPSFGGLPLPFDIALPDGTTYRPFGHLRKLVATSGVPYAIIQSVLQNNDGQLEVFHISESFRPMKLSKSQPFHFQSLTFLM